MTMTRYLGAVIWRLQVLASFALLNVFPLAAVVVLNGVLFGTSQGEEILQDLWWGRFMQEADSWVPHSWQRSVGFLVTLAFGSAIWVTSRVLCDAPARKTLAGFVRIRTDAPEACFVRRVGPAGMALVAVAPLLTFFAIGLWADLDLVNPWSSTRLNTELVLDRALQGLVYAGAAALALFVFLFPVIGQWKARFSNAQPRLPSTLLARAWRVCALCLGAGLLPFACLGLLGTPALQELNVHSIHGGGFVHVRERWGAAVFVVLSLVLMVAGRATLGEALRRDFSAPPPAPGARQWSYLAGVFAVCALLVSAVWIDSVRAPQEIGFIALLMVVGTFWSVLFSIGLVVVPQRLGAPSLALLPLLLFAAFSGRNDNHQLDAVVEQRTAWDLLGKEGRNLQACLAAENKAALERMDEDLRRWILQRIDAPPGVSIPVDIPVFVVSGSGGGVRAAEFFARTMARLDELTKGRFGDHVFALSTVSGASLGAAVWIKARGAAYERLPDSDGRFDVTFDMISRFFQHDYISPVAAGLILRDAAQQLLPFQLPGGDRARVMERAWDNGWQRSIAEEPRLAGQSAEFGMLSQLVTAGSVQHPAPPLVVFNSTEVHTGRRFLTANRRLPSSWFFDSYLAVDRCALHGIADMRLATAAHLSARFTLVSPAASIRGLPDDKAWDAISYRLPITQVERADRPVPWGQVVDGGYFENYGATTAKEITRGIAQSFMRLRAAERIPSNVNLRFVGLSVVNDPLDLGNISQHSVRMVSYQSYNLEGDPVSAKEPRFEAIWPIGNSYDVREFRGLLGLISPIEQLVTESRLSNELAAPLLSVLNTRESRGLTAEREFREYLEVLRAVPVERSPISGAWFDVRLGRMLRDTNLLTFSSGGMRLPRRPSIGQGSYSMPNPGLAWFLSVKSKQGILESVRIKPRYPSRYQRFGDIEQIVRALDQICERNLRCAATD